MQGPLPLLAAGIDLGSAHVRVALADGGDAAVVPVGGAGLVPSFVSFGADRVLIGDRARARAATHPQHTVRVTPALLAGGPIRLGEQDRGADEIAAWLLAAARTAIERTGRPASRIVVATATDLADAALAALSSGAERAGLELLGTCSALAAAGVAFASERTLVSGRIAIVDAGASGVEAALLDVDGSTLHLVGRRSAREAGGLALDACVLEEVLAGLPDVARAAVRRSAALRESLRQECESARWQLSERDDAEVSLALLEPVLGDGAPAGSRVDRAWLDRVELPAVLAAGAACLRLVVEVGELGPVDHLLLLGGLAGSPRLRGVVERIFGVAAEEIDPLETVARGAALTGLVLQGAPGWQVQEEWIPPAPASEEGVPAVLSRPTLPAQQMPPEPTGGPLEEVPSAPPTAPTAMLPARVEPSSPPSRAATSGALLLDADTLRRSSALFPELVGGVAAPPPEARQHRSTPPPRRSTRPEAPASAIARFAPVHGARSVAAVAALPLARKPTEAERSPIALPVLLLDVGHGRTRTGVLTLARGDEKVAVSIFAGDPAPTGAERDAITAAFGWEHGTYAWRGAPGLTMVPSRKREPMRHLVTRGLRAVVEQLGEPACAAALESRLRLAPWASPRCAEALHGLGLPPADLRFVTQGFDGRRTGLELVRGSELAPVRVLSLLVVLEAFDAFEWQLPPSPVDPALRARVTDAAARIAAARDPFEALGVARTASTHEVAEAWLRIRHEYGPSGACARLAADAASLVLERATAAWALLADEGEREKMRDP